MADPKIAQLIADALSSPNGIKHPGDEDHPPWMIRLPLFRMAGRPPEVHKQVQLTVKAIAEAVVHVIETEGNSDIIERTEDSE